jgi:hypothetical protein
MPAFISLPISLQEEVLGQVVERLDAPRKAGQPKLASAGRNKLMLKTRLPTPLAPLPPVPATHPLPLSFI